MGRISRKRFHHGAQQIPMVETPRTLREWAKKGRIERRYGDDKKVYYRIDTARKEGGNGGSKAEADVEDISAFGAFSASGDADASAVAPEVNLF